MVAGRGGTRRITLIYSRVFACNFVKFFNPFARMRVYVFVCVCVCVCVCDPAKKAEHSGDAATIVVSVS